MDRPGAAIPAQSSWNTPDEGRYGQDCGRPVRSGEPGAAAYYSRRMAETQPMAGTQPLDWRAVLALLANPDTRAAFAEVVAPEPLPAAQRARAVQRLVAAGLLEPGPDGRPVVAEARLRAALRAAAPPPVTGPERFLSAAGRIVDYPSRWSDREQVLQLVVSRTVDIGEELTEGELGERLLRVGDDVATLRRYLVDARLLERSPDGRSYRRAGEDGPRDDGWPD